MTIDAIDVYRYALPLSDPLQVGRGTIRERRGLLLRVTLINGGVGWGDSAPLPQFSSESVDEAATAAKQLAASAGSAFRDVDDPTDGLAWECWSEGRAPSSLQFALDSAVLEAIAAAQGRVPSALLGATSGEVVLNALVPDDARDLRREGERLRHAAYQAVKLKVGRRSVAADVERVRTLRQALGSDVALRLDANRAWTMDEAVRFMEMTGDLSLAYIEEPLEDPHRLDAFVQQTGCPVALDETTREMSPEHLGEWPVSAVVLKPTLLGGLSDVQAWCRAAHEQGAVPVVSASYESGVGIRMLAALASALSGSPAGLSTYTRLADDVLTPRLDVDGAVVDGDELYESAVDANCLSLL